MHAGDDAGRCTPAVFAYMQLLEECEQVMRSRVACMRRRRRRLSCHPQVSGFMLCQHSARTRRLVSTCVHTHTRARQSDNNVLVCRERVCGMVVYSQMPVVLLHKSV